MEKEAHKKRQTTPVKYGGGVAIQHPRGTPDSLVLCSPSTEGGGRVDDFSVYVLWSSDFGG